MKFHLYPVVLLLLMLTSAVVRPDNPKLPPDNDSFVVHAWFFGNDLPTVTPLQTINSTYGQFSGGKLEFVSALTGYPFNPFHPQWRKASLERHDAPTPLNYYPEVNGNISYQNSGMTGIQIRQPFTSADGENTLIFRLPSTGFRELIFSFAARDEGAAENLLIDYALTEENPQWISTGMLTNSFPLGNDYSLFEIYFTDSATCAPPLPPDHGLSEDQQGIGTFMLVNDNPDFRIRIRFSGSNMSADEGKMVTFNNFILWGKPASEDYQIIDIPAGWSGISSNILPTNPLITHMLYPINQELVILQNFSGFYWPSAGTNTLGYWDETSGYSIKNICNTELLLTGNPPEELSCSLNQGWNYLPVLSKCNMPAELLFSQIINQVIVVKEIAGDLIYWPAFGINTLGNLIPGRAYLAMMLNNAVVEFQNCSQKPSENNKSVNFSGTTSVKDTSIVHTPFTHIIALTASDRQLNKGDRIEARGKDGKCYGSTIWNEKFTTLTLYGNDPTTSVKDGLNEYEPFTLSATTGTEQNYRLEPVFDPEFPQKHPFFVTNGLSVISAVTLSNTEPFQPADNSPLQVSPNPANDNFLLTIGKPNFKTGWLNIFRMDGTIVKSLPVEHKSQSISVVELNSGIYLLQVSSENEMLSKRLVIK